MPVHLRRSLLYVPGSNDRAIAKAAALDADTVILDLEDAVAPAGKATARERVVAVLRERAFGGREVAVRINALSTPWGRDDLDAVATSGPDAVLFPKIETAAQASAMNAALGQAGAPDHTAFWTMVETPAAVADVMAIAGIAAGPDCRLEALVMGTNDLALQTRVRPGPGRAPLQAWLSACVLAARRFGLDVIDGVYNRLDNEEGFAAECRQAREFGFDGKSLIHPRQIGVCNGCFSPGAEEVAWARAVVEAFDDPANARQGAVRVMGGMVEHLHVDAATRILALAEAVAARAAASAGGLQGGRDGET